MEGNNEETKKGSKQRSWVWQHVEIKQIGGDNRAVCCISDCKWNIMAKCSSGLTGAIANHLLSHEVYPPNNNQPTNKNRFDSKLANYYLIKFIVTGFLPFLIVENEAFKK